MARKIIIKEDGLAGSGNAPSGYKFIGDSLGDISEKVGATVSAIGGSAHPAPTELTVELTTANLTTDIAVPLFSIPQDKLLTSLEISLIYRAGSVGMVVGGFGDYTLIRTSQEGYGLGGFRKDIFDGWTSANIIEKFVWSSGVGGSFLWGFTQGLANESIDWRSDQWLSGGNGTATLLIRYTLIDMPV